MTVIGVDHFGRSFKFTMDPYLQYLLNICKNIRYILCDENVPYDILRDLWNAYNFVKENTDNFKRVFNDTTHDTTTVIRFRLYMNPEQTVSMTIAELSNIIMILETVHMQIQMRTPHHLYNWIHFKIL